MIRTAGLAAYCNYFSKKKKFTFKPTYSKNNKIKNLLSNRFR